MSIAFRVLRFATTPVAIAGVCFCTPGVSAQFPPPLQTWHVDEQGPGGDGRSWPEAFNSLQTAIEMAGPNHLIKVGGGTYVPSKEHNALDPRAKWFEINDGVRIQGGYAGYDDMTGELAEDPNLMDPAQFESILSGDLDDDGTLAGNSYHVVAAINIPNAQNFQTILDGFTIRGGNADGDPNFTEGGLPLGHRAKGGGLYAINSKLNVLRCTFIDNHCRGNGLTTGLGGAALVEGSLTGSEGTDFINCVFKENTANRGGALAVLGDAANQQFEFWPVTTKATMTNCLLIKNGAVDAPEDPNVPGSGSNGTATVYLYQQTGFKMTNCIVTENDVEIQVSAISVQPSARSDTEIPHGSWLIAHGSSLMTPAATDPDHAMNLAFGLNILFETYSPAFACGEQ